MKIGLLLVLLSMSGLALAQDAEAGKEAFKECAACHSTKAGETLLGPSLAGVYGRKAGSLEGFRYSNAMKKSGVTWDESTLDAYIADPQALIPGNRMPYSGMADANSRKNVIAYLKTL
jgi:cytochrome c